MNSPALHIVEVSPRDGLQNETAAVSTKDKIALVLACADAGARRIEAVSFVNPKAVPQMADAEAVMEGLAGAGLGERGVSLSGLILNRRGLDRALKAKVDEANFVVTASETFNRRNQGSGIEGTMEQLEQCAQVCATEGMPLSVTIGVAFGCPFEGEVPVTQVAALAGRMRDMGLCELALADTVGVADPAAVETRLAAVKAVVGDLTLRCHFHDTRHTGVANAYAAWRSGVRVLDASLGGVGGCPFAPGATGNVATEDLVYMFERMGVSTGLDLSALIQAAQHLGARLGKTLPSALIRAGGFPGDDGAAKRRPAASASSTTASRVF
jgi:hydroxymethylglutaryl-CoA lyase